MAVATRAPQVVDATALKSDTRTDHRRNTVLILDFGGQYCHLIARSVRELNVYSEIVNPNITANEIRELQKQFNIKGIILSGGPQSVYGNDSHSIDPNILEMNIPVLGLCYGHQLIAHLARGDVKPAPKKEFGDTTVSIDKPSGILKGLGNSAKVWMSHSDTVISLPNDYEVIAHSDNTPVAAFKHRTKPIFGLQWHPEVIHTEQGNLMLRNFVLDICKSKPEWKMAEFIPSSVERIKETVGNGRAIVALSGGVDSTVAAALVGRAIDGRLIAVYIDTGLMRERETDEIRSIFEASGANLRVISAKERFLKELEGIRSPEKKRKIIGREFARVFEEVAKEVNADFLVQGTIYPDRVESGATGRSAVIKTHHNVGGMPKNVKFKAIIEPLKDLYKDEVRNLAAELELPESIVHRQPFPGPGLAVRIIGSITEDKLEVLRRADKIVTSELESSGVAKDLWQYFAVLTGTKAVGVKGDVRAYGHVVAFRTVTGRDAMTARFGELPWDLVRKISTRITNEIPSVTRVVYDTTDKPPGTIEWE